MAPVASECSPAGAKQRQPPSHLVNDLPRWVLGVGSGCRDHTVASPALAASRQRQRPWAGSRGGGRKCPAARHMDRCGSTRRLGQHGGALRSLGGAVGIGAAKCGLARGRSLLPSKERPVREPIPGSMAAISPASQNQRSTAGFSAFAVQVFAASRRFDATLALALFVAQPTKPGRTHARC